MIASLLSLSRFPLALLVFYEVAVAGSGMAAAFLILLGTLTDFLDGWVARNFGQKTRIGAHLDHIGDKFFVLLTLTAFYLKGDVGFLPLLLLAFREISITLLRFYGLVGSVNGLGKLKTTVEFLSLVTLCLEPNLGKALLWVAVFLAYLSAVFYIKRPLRVGL